MLIKPKSEIAATISNANPPVTSEKFHFPRLPANPNCEIRYQGEKLLNLGRDWRAEHSTGLQVELKNMHRKSNPKIENALFLSETEIAMRLNQSPSSWQAKAIILERHGFPRIDPLMGGRYWPAVEAYWQRRYGLSSMDVHQPDGKENVDAL